MFSFFAALEVFHPRLTMFGFRGINRGALICSTSSVSEAVRAVVVDSKAQPGPEEGAAVAAPREE